MTPALNTPHRKASAFNSWFENAEEDMTDPVHCNNIDEVKVLKAAHDTFKESLSEVVKDFDELAEMDKKVQELDIGENPYTWFTMETLKETWENLERLIKEREEELAVEHRRQEESDRLRRKGPVTHEVHNCFRFVNNAPSLVHNCMLFPNLLDIISGPPTLYVHLSI